MKPLTAAKAAAMSFQLFIGFGYRHRLKIVYPPDLIRPQSSDFGFWERRKFP
jgi:hypothetical protein